MLIQEKIGNTNSYSLNVKTIDLVDFEWYETNKRIQRKTTKSGKELILKFLNDNPSLTQGMFGCYTKKYV
jgi:urease accessory protein